MRPFLTPITHLAAPPGCVSATPKSFKDQHRDTRGVPSLDMLRQDLRYAWRTLRRDAGFVAMWEAPFFRKSTGLVKALPDGWQIQGYGVFQTGNPISVTNSAAYPAGDYNADNNAGDRPNAPSGVKTSGWSNNEYLAGIFAVADFPRPAAGTNGNLPRNAYRGPGFSEVSLSLAKKIVIGGSFQAEVRLDAFNVFNTMNLGDPVMDLSNANFGKSTTQLATRAMQLGFRLRF